MNETLMRVKDVVAEGCVTLILNTHRTKPDNQKDTIALKTLTKEAKARLVKRFDKKVVKTIMNNIDKISDHIDHSHNLESLILFANSDLADYTRLPLTVKERVVIDNTFATRDIIRSLNEQAGYYILVLSRQRARLIEAYNDKVVKEFGGDFPLDNTIYTTSKHKLSTGKGSDNLIEEFFNQTDKLVNEAIKSDPKPILLVTETRNFDHYLKVADRKELIAGHVTRNRGDETAHQIVTDGWKIVKELLRELQEKRIAELKKAIPQRKVVTDYNEIWGAIHEGRGSILFVKRGFFQPALIIEGVIVPTEERLKEQKGAIDDIVDEMIELNRQYGGDTVFIADDEYMSQNSIALVTRF